MVLCNGLGLLRLAEFIRGRPSSPPVLDSVFPLSANDDKLDGLFWLTLLIHSFTDDLCSRATSTSNTAPAAPYKWLRAQS